jgi:hypothetical protein
VLACIGIESEFLKLVENFLPKKKLVEHFHKQTREFYLYATKKIARDLCAIESWVHTHMPLTPIFENRY